MNQITKNGHKHNMLLNIEDAIYHFKRTKYAYKSKTKCLCKKAEQLDKIYKIKGTLHKVYNATFIKHIFTKAFIPINHNIINIGDPQNENQCYYCYARNNPKKIVIWKNNYISVNNKCWQISEILGKHSGEYNKKINYETINMLYEDKVFKLYNYNNLHKKSVKITRDAKSIMKGIQFANDNVYTRYNENDIFILREFPQENNLKKIIELNIDMIKKTELTKFKLLESMYIYARGRALYTELYQDNIPKFKKYRKYVKYFVDNLPHLKYLRISFWDVTLLFENKQDIQYYISNCDEDYD